MTVPSGASTIPDLSAHAVRRGVAARARYVLMRTPLVVWQAPAAAVGGQAVMDGVMMRGPHSWAVAVRRHDGSIAVEHRELVAFATKHAWARIPLVRGVVALVEALVIGMRALFVSSEYAIEGVEAAYAEEAAALESGDDAIDVARAEAHDVHEVEVASSLASSTGALGAPVPLPHGAPGEHDRPDPDSLSTAAIVGAMVVALAFSVGLFKVVPVTLVTFLPIDRDSWGFVIVEALVKFAIFCIYLTAVGMMADMKRVFQYHSAEHKAINAWEHGVALEPEAVNRMSRIHVRCGTAFIVWLFLVGLLVFRVAQLTFLEGAGRLEIILTRPLLLPIIAGLSFELLRFAGRHADNGPLRVVLAPGLWFQRLTTRECTPDQCEVAIRSLEVVLAHEQARAAEQASDDGAGSKRPRTDDYEILA